MAPSKRNNNKRQKLDPTVDRVPVMQNKKQLDFCCGIDYQFKAKNKDCLRTGCENVIEYGEYYYSYDRDKYIYCEDCYSIFASEFIIAKDEDKETHIPRAALLRKRNLLTPEPTIRCSKCGNVYHTICAMYVESINKGFLCKNCYSVFRIRPVNSFTAKALSHTHLSQYLEKRLDSYLMTNKVVTGKVHIRVLLSTNKFIEPGPNMKNVFKGENVKFPYREKAIFAFQEIGGIEVAFFAVLVQEYGHNCPLPNRGRIYLSYVDSVHYFTPKAYRTLVYQEILLSYLEYMKNLGFSSVHIWVCPPGHDGDYDYLFNSHPKEQKMPTLEHLKEWYKKLIQKGERYGIITGYKNLFTEFRDLELKSVADIPYFEGDHFPKLLENIVAEYGNKPAKLPHKKHMSLVNRYCKANNLDASMQNALLEMFLYKDAFLWVRLNENPFSVADNYEPEIICEILLTRDPFLSFARQRDYEFSSLRRAKFSTKGLLYEIHKKTKIVPHVEDWPQKTRLPFLQTPDPPRPITYRLPSTLPQERKDDLPTRKPPPLKIIRQNGRIEKIKEKKDENREKCWKLPKENRPGLVLTEIIDLTKD